VRVVFFSNVCRCLHDGAVPDDSELWLDCPKPSCVRKAGWLRKKPGASKVGLTRVARTDETWIWRPFVLTRHMTNNTSRLIYFRNIRELQAWAKATNRYFGMARTPIDLAKIFIKRSSVACCLCVPDVVLRRARTLWRVELPRHKPCGGHAGC